jgi:myo-inositol 2-dehydrogenase/D-chiro-inositol 1-dehydrogenase
MSSFDSMRVAIVGAGRMGQTRAEAATRLGAHVIAVCDADEASGGALAKAQADCRFVSDVAELPWTDLDAVFICVPPFAHGACERLALRHGVAMFIEKPIALNAPSIAEVVRQATSEGLVTAVGYMNRHRESVRMARRQLLNANVLGLCGNWVCGAYSVPWWEREELSGGPINEQATHILDLARYLIGDVVEVQARAGEGEIAYSINLRFASGPTGALFYACGSEEKSIRMQVFTTGATVHLAGWEFDLFGAGQPVDPPTRSREERNAIFVTEVERFFSQVRKKAVEEPLCDLGEAYRTQQLVDAVKEALRQGRAVHVPGRE